MQQTWHSSLSSFASELAQVHSSKSNFSQIEPAHCWGGNILELFHLIKLRIKPNKIVKWMQWPILNFTMFALYVWLHKAEPGKGAEFASPLWIPRTRFQPSTTDASTKLAVTGGFLLLQRMFGARILRQMGDLFQKQPVQTFCLSNSKGKENGCFYWLAQERQLQRANGKRPGTQTLDSNRLAL